ncbi:MAG: DUF2283 domain-containing protein [Chloroflexi bacterium]|nr:MAG: DUF2283 domain-containing protein [Chloroflexota bacterium]
MNNPKMLYFEKEDVLHLVLQDGPEQGSFELSPDITIEVNEAGEMIGVEILNASRFIRDSVLESFQAKLVLQPAAA